MSSFQTLTSSRYYPPGCYIGQIIQPSPGSVNVPRVPCYVGQGSRFAYAQDLQIRRAFVYGETLTFPSSSPYIAPLEYNASNQKAVARLYTSNGVVVKTNQWNFVEQDPAGSKIYASIMVNPEAFDINQTYKLDYQSVDRNVHDYMPVEDVREVMALGMSPGSPDFTEYTDYFLDYTMTEPQPGHLPAPAGLTPTSTNHAHGFSAVTKTSSGTAAGTVAIHASSAYNHDYNRFYQLRCVEQTANYAVFAWKSSPMSAGEGKDRTGATVQNQPNIPTNVGNSTIPLAASIYTAATAIVPVSSSYPIIKVLSTAQTSVTIPDGNGILLDFDHVDTSGFIVDDLFTFNAYGPALFEVDQRINSNTNQIAESGPVTSSSSTVTLDFDATNNPTNELNAYYKVKCLTSTGVTASGSVTPTAATKAYLAFGSTGVGLLNLDTTIQAKMAGLSGNDITITVVGDSTPTVRHTRSGSDFTFNFQTGVSTVTDFEFVIGALSGADALIEVKAAGTGANVLTSAGDDLAVTSLANGNNVTSLVFTSTVGGVAGNNASATRKVTFTSGAFVAATYASGVLAVTYVTGVSKYSEIVTAVSALATTGITAAKVGTNDPVLTSPVSDVVMAGGVDNTCTFGVSEYGNVINAVMTSGSKTQTTYPTVSAAPTITLFDGVVVKMDCLSGSYKVDAQAVLTTAQIVFHAREVGSAGNLLTVEIKGKGATIAVTQVGNNVIVALSGAGDATVSAVVSAINDAGVSVTAVGSGGGNAALISRNYLAGGTDADTFTFPVKAPRQFYHAHDSRNIVLTVAGATSAVGSGTVTGQYTTDTPEGGFGLFTATANAQDPNNATYANGSFTLPGNIIMYARNLFGGPTSASVTGSNRHTVADVHTNSAQMGWVDNQSVRHSTFNWSLVEYATENVSYSQILTDVSGLATGSTPGTSYVILNHVPDTIEYVQYAPLTTRAGQSISYTLKQDASGNNTQYLVFATKPTLDPAPFTTGEALVTIYYQYRGMEPNPGEFYFLTGKYIRPDEFYNTPILLSSLDDGRKLLYPMEITNHLGIMNEIVMGDVGASQMYVVQVKDLDQDGYYTDLDFKNAITASEQPINITDLIVLSHFSSLNDQLASVTNMSDPFKQRFRMAWVGAQIGTSIGDESTSGSLVYLAQRTLQTHGTSPAHGTRVLLSPTTATRDIQLDNGTTVEVTLDGSFVAGATAGLVASFTDPGTDVLRKNLPGFKTIQTYGEIGSPENLILGGNNILFLTNQGSGVYRFEENITVDNFASDFLLINNMTQKMAVTKYIREDLDSKVIGIVVPSSQAGIGLIQGFLVNALAGLVAQGVIGRYQTADGQERPIDASQDVVVQRDSLDPTHFNLMYNYFLRNTIKRITGLYSVNSANFGTGV